MDFRFDPASHRYHLDAKELIGLTRALKLGGVAEGYEYVNEGVLELARERGKAVHKATELHDRGRLDESSVHPAVAPYLAAWRSFLALKRVQVIDIERPIFSKKWGFACTPDRTVFVNGKLGVLEIKASDYMSDAYALQTEGQRIAAAEFYKTNFSSRFVVRLRSDGTYRLEQFRNLTDRINFLRCLSIAKKESGQ